MDSENHLKNPTVNIEQNESLKIEDRWPQKGNEKANICQNTVYSFLAHFKISEGTLCRKTTHFFAPLAV